MPGENGYTPPPDDTPEALAARLFNGGKHGATTAKDMLRTLDDHNARQIPLHPNLLQAFQIVVADLMQASAKDGRPIHRVRKYGAELLIKAIASNRELYGDADNMARLDTPGAPTERVEQTAPPLPKKVMDAMRDAWDRE